MKKETRLLINADRQICLAIQRMLMDGNREFILCNDSQDVFAAIKERTPDLAILGERVDGENGTELFKELLSRFPNLPIILLIDQETPEIFRQAMKLGIQDCLTLPVRSQELTETVKRCLQRVEKQKQWIGKEVGATSELHRQVEELETLTGLGRSITSTLNLDEVFASIVKAAVKLTGADEGSLLLLDDASGELYMRAAHNFQDDFVRTFRLQVKDSTISSVIVTGKPFLLNESTPQKIKTAFLVRSLIYVPLFLHNRPVGVLGVDNRVENKLLSEHDVKLLEALAEFAVIAIENARLFAGNEQEKNKLETILRSIQDGVLVIDREDRIVLLNNVARSLLNLPDEDVIGERYARLVKQKELIELLENEDKYLDRIELTGSDGRVFDARMVIIPEVGRGVSIHDITQLKKMDRMKSEFVNTVSHDLRSPLTAIIGYAELISRVGSINEMQQEFVDRILANAQNITRLINELLNLGRIEAGFDNLREETSMYRIIQASMENQTPKSDRKQITLKADLQPDIPEIMANPIQLRQVMDNLIDNAIKYTLQGGSVTVRAFKEQNQVICQVADSGIGIPAADLPNIFDKFFRSGNVGNIEGGIGLGLSIVRSIIESHHGRIWVDSTEGRGSTFSVVLPLEG